MNKQKFLRVVRQVNSVNGDDLAKLKSLEEVYPYSAILHSLVAKISKDQKDKNAQASIHQAALYATDRAVLKELLAGHIRELTVLAKRPDVKQEPTEIVKIDTDTKPAVSKELPKDFVHPDNPTADDHLSQDEAEALRNEVLGNLSALANHKENFEKILIPKKTKKVSKEKVAKPSSRPATKAAGEIAKEPGATKAKTATVAKKGSNASKTVGITQKAEPKKTAVKAKSKSKFLDQNAKPAVTKTVKRTKPATKKATTISKTASPSKAKSGAKKPSSVKSTKASGPAVKKRTSKPKATAKPTKSKSKESDLATHVAIGNIESAREQEPKNKEQIELIEKFIKKKPKIPKKPRKQAKPVDQEDLSTGSTMPNEDLVTENLAEIYVMQEKPNKAIDIYKKLIWKFPQKKAFFASQIEKLKKK